MFLILHFEEASQAVSLSQGPNGDTRIPWCDQLHMDFSLTDKMLKLFKISQ